jgi:hypothetical protein
MNGVQKLTDVKLNTILTWLTKWVIGMSEGLTIQ